MSSVTNRHISADNRIVSSIEFSPSTNCQSNSVLVLFVCYKNSADGGTDPFNSIVDTKSNTWTLQNDIVQSPNNITNDGICLRQFTTVQDGGVLLTTDTITINLDIDSETYAVSLFEINNPTLIFKDSNINSQSNDLYPSITTISLRTNNILIGASCSTKNDIRNADADTVNGSWSTMYDAGISGTYPLQLITQYKILTGNGVQTFNPTFTNSGVEEGIEIASSYIVYSDSIEPPTNSFFIINSVVGL